MTLQAWDWQRADLSYLADQGFTGLLAIEVGGGKTATTVFAMQELQPEITLIIAPEATFKTPNRNWPVAVGDLVNQEVKRIGNSNKRENLNRIGFELGEPGVYVTTPQFFARESTNTLLWRGDLLVIDEIHKLCTARSRGQRKLSGYSPSDPAPISTRFTHRLALSGTPMRQNFQNMWGTMRFLWPELSGRGEIADENYFRWCQDRMTNEIIPLEWEWVPITAQNPAPEGARVNRIGGVPSWMKVTKKATNFLVEAEPGLLVSEMPCVIIHKRREKCCEFHPEGFLDIEEPQVIERVVDLTPKQKKAIKELEDHYMTWLDDNPFIVELSMVQKQRIRQLCLAEAVVEYYWGEDKNGDPIEKSRLEFEPDAKSPFLDELIDILSNLEEDEPVIVFMESQRFANVVTARLKALGIKAEEFSGKTKADLTEFGKAYRVLVAVTSAIGEGTDGLQQVCNTEVWLETPVSITMETQSKARLDRLGARKQVQSYVVKDSEGYAEGRINTNLEKKLSINKSLRREING